jgi:alkylhydroperoxidase family enzyme
MSDLIPRLSSEQMPADLALFLAPRIERLGYLGEFFQCAAHQPAALLSFLEFTEHLKHALPQNLSEVVVLSVAALMENDYERIQHERLCQKLGFSETWVADVLSLNPESTSLSSSERHVQRLTIAVVRRGGRETKAELDAVVEATGPARAIAVLMLIGRYVSHALMVNSLDLAPPAPALAAHANGLVIP